MVSPRMELPTFGGNNELVEQLVRHRVRFLVVGGAAVNFYVAERTADDLDLLVEPTPDNAERLFAALAALHLTPQFPQDVISRPTERPQQMPLKTVYYADLLTPGPAVNFATEWDRASLGSIGGNEVRVAARGLLIEMKVNTNRERDASDVDLLQKESM